MNKTSLGDRMKGYENVTRHYLTRRMPVIIRLDGKNFHSFTRGFKKPFDDILVSVMQKTMYELCEKAEGCVMGYTQSDEISLILCDYEKLDTEAWFGNGLLKMCSISASIATSAFNKYFRCAVSEMPGVYEKRIDMANFDSRVFSLPKEEVCNYMIWRQKDAVRNSIQATAQAYFSHNQLNGVPCSRALEMLRDEKSVIWEDFPLKLQRGSCCIKKPVLMNEGQPDEVLRNKWFIDEEIPVFSEDRDYVEKRIIFEG